MKKAFLIFCRCNCQLSDCQSDMSVPKTVNTTFKVKIDYNFPYSYRIFLKRGTIHQRAWRCPLCRRANSVHKCHCTLYTSAHKNFTAAHESVCTHWQCSVPVHARGRRGAHAAGVTRCKSNEHTGAQGVHEMRNQ